MTAGGLALLGAGLTYQEAAVALGCRWRTVSTHAGALLGKLGAENMTTAAVWALLAGRHTPGQIVDVWRQHRPHLVEQP